MRARTALITGGRAPVALDLARNLTRLGWRVLVAESDPFALSASSNAVTRFYPVPAPNDGDGRYVESIGKIMAEESVDVLIPTCEEVFHLAERREYLQAQAKPGSRLCFDHLETLERLHSKFAFNQWIRELGLPAPSSVRATDRGALKDAAVSMKGDRVVLKPEYSRFAVSARVLRKTEIADLIPQIDVSPQRPWIAQEHLGGIEYCTYTLVDDGRITAHCVYEHEFTAGKGAGICFQAIHHPEIDEWIRKFVEKIKFTGQIAFDFIETEDRGPLPIECNPRSTSGLHLLLQGSQPRDLFALPTDAPPILPRYGSTAQISLAMVFYGLPSVRSIRRLRSWFRIFFGARETILSLDDPMPFFYQFSAFYRLIRLAKCLGLTPLEASTRDIEWNGGTSGKH